MKRLREEMLDRLHSVEKFVKEQPELDKQMEECISNALKMLGDYGMTEGDHHRCWVIDQTVRILLGDRYDEWIAKWCRGGEYYWDKGVAP